MKDVLLLLSTILNDLWVKLYEYLMRGCEKACQKAWPPVNIKTAIFNQQYLSHLCMDFNVTNMSRIIIIIMYFIYSAQYLHILQDSKRYLTNPTVQVQPQLTSN